MRVSYRAQDFAPGPIKNGPGSITTTWPELVHAAITVGRRGWRDVLRHGRYSLFEMSYRAAVLLANLQRSRGRIVKSDAYHALDPSEKAAVSYFIGLTLANLMARRMFRVRWLMHLDVYQRTLHPSLSTSGRPDLVGSSRLGRWYVIEAKGRSNGLSKRLVARAKDQTQKLKLVCGKPPSARVASVAFFSRNGHLTLRLADPPTPHPDAVDWPFAESQFLRDYYDPFVTLLDQAAGLVRTLGFSADRRSDEIGGMEVLFAPLPYVDLEVGLTERIYDVVSAGEATRDEVNSALHLGHDRSEDTPGILEELPSSQGRTCVGSDGIVVRLGPKWFDRPESESQG